MRHLLLGRLPTSVPCLCCKLPAFGSCPLVFESGNSNVLVNQAGMANLPGVSYGKCHASPPKRQEKGSMLGGQTHLPSCPLACQLKVKAERFAFHARIAWQTHCHVLSVEVGNE